MITPQLIEKIKTTIIEDLTPLQITMFGSYAYGQPTSDSDLDILVITQTEDEMEDSYLALKSKLISKDYSLDLLLLSKAEYDKNLSEGWRLFEDIEKKGKILYAK